MGGINCTEVYTRGQTHYAIKYLLLPASAGERGLLASPSTSRRWPAASSTASSRASVRTRTRSGWYIHSAIAGALAEVLFDRVMAPNGLLGSTTGYGQTPTAARTTPTSSAAAAWARA
ncbi:MAG: hypothetical protein U0822_12575 [Anaerolineae bacterium]